MTKFLLTVASVAAAATLPAPALFAATIADVPTVAVSYTDLNLANDAGVDALRHRVASAAQRVCGDYDSRDARAFGEARRCQAIALNDAQPQMDQAITNAHGGPRLADAAGSMTVRAR